MRPPFNPHPNFSAPHLAPGYSISLPLIPLSLEARGGGGHHPCPAVISRSPLVQQVVHICCVSRLTSLYPFISDTKVLRFSFNILLPLPPKVTTTPLVKVVTR